VANKIVFIASDMRTVLNCGNIITSNKAGSEGLSSGVLGFPSSSVLRCLAGRPVSQPKQPQGEDETGIGPVAPSLHPGNIFGKDTANGKERR